MLKFNEIKRDYNQGYKYFEYEGTWYGNMVTLILDCTHANSYVNGSLIFDITTHTTTCTGIIPMDDFMAMSYKDFVKYITHYMYYNTIELEVQ